MTSLIFGITCIYLAVKTLRLSEDAFQAQVDAMTKPPKPMPEGYYRFLRGCFLGIGILGGAMIVLRFF